MVLVDIPLCLGDTLTDQYQNQFYHSKSKYELDNQVVLVDIPLCMGDTLADWLQAGGLILGVDGLREDTARYF